MNFSENQEKAISHFEGNCNVLATAGSGKTHVLTHRIVNLIEEHGASPGSILAITFSRKAADNMNYRLSRLIPSKYNSVNIETFHSWGLKILRKFKGGTFNILSSDYDRLKILQKIDEEVDDPSAILNYISLNKNKLNPPAKVPSTYSETMYARYEEEKERQDSIDFDDMLFQTFCLLNNNPDALQYCIDNFKFILIDESQDVNTAQMELLKLIGKPNNNVFIVGDILQCVYNWRGADNGYVRDFHNDWDSVTIINLDTNYRSTKNIVDFSNNFARHIEDFHYRFYKNSIADKASHKDTELMVYSDEFDEAFGIADSIKALIDTKQYDFKDIAILSRTNAQLQIFESVFYNADLPCGIMGGLSFVNRREIRLILSYLKLANNKNDDDSFKYVYCQPTRRLGKKFLEGCKSIGYKKCLSLYESMIELSHSQTHYELGINELRFVIDSLIQKDWNDVSEQINSLEQIAGQYKTSAEFIEYMDKFSGKNQNTENGILLSTLHRSKGLEWPVVFLVGINDGVLPHKRNLNIEEEKRLCYVGITRAEKELYCCTYNEQSQFIQLLFNNKKRG